MLKGATLKMILKSEKKVTELTFGQLLAKITTIAISEDLICFKVIIYFLRLFEKGSKQPVNKDWTTLAAANYR